MRSKKVEEAAPVGRKRFFGGRRAAVALSCCVLAGATGCSTLHPGAAAVVASQSIEASTVDDIALAYCTVTVAAAREAGSSSTQPTRDLRRGVLNALVQARVVGAAAQHLGGISVTAAQVHQLVDSGAVLPQSAPVADTETVRSFLGSLARTQLTLQAIGERLLKGSGSGQPPSAASAVNAGKTYVVKYAAGMDVSVDPRYGSYSPRGIEVRSGSLSVPVSSEALQAVSPTLDASSAGNLPASQTCT